MMQLVRELLHQVAELREQVEMLRSRRYPGGPPESTDRRRLFEEFERRKWNELEERHHRERQALEEALRAEWEELLQQRGGDAREHGERREQEREQDREREERQGLEMWSR